MAIDANVVRRVGEYQIRGLAAEKAGVGSRSAGIAAQKAMGAEDPQIPTLASGSASADQRQLIVCGRQARRLEGLVQQKIDVGRFKAGQFDLKSDIDQTLQLNGQ